MSVKELLQLLQKVNDKDINLQYVGVYGNTFPITKIETEVGYLILVTGSKDTISLRKLVKYLLTVDDNTRVQIKLSTGNYRLVEGVTSLGGIKILPTTFYVNSYIINSIKYNICSNCEFRRCATLCKVAIRQYCDMYGFRLLQ